MNKLREEVEKTLWSWLVPKVKASKKIDKKNAEVMTKVLAYQLGMDKEIKRMANELCSLFHTTMMEVIGEDRENNALQGTSEAFQIMGENRLRQEQRARCTKLMK